MLVTLIRQLVSKPYIFSIRGQVMFHLALIRNDPNLLIIYISRNVITLKKNEDRNRITELAKINASYSKLDNQMKK